MISSDENKQKVMESYAKTNSTGKTGKELGIDSKEVWRILRICGISTKKQNTFSAYDIEFLRLNYEKIVDSGGLEALSSKMGRTKQFLSRQAKKLGLTKYGRPRTQESYKKGVISFKKWIDKNGHPKGFKGYRHTDKAKSLISKSSKKMWENKSDIDRVSATLRGIEFARRYSVLPKKRSWKQAWHEIGGKRHFFRSSWEVNFAKYLEFMKQHKKIIDWQFEPEVFWFFGIKRGVRSYLPDFKVFNNDGTHAFYEVKGWMDPKSKTKIKRFKKYHPKENLIVVDSKAYASLKKSFGFLFDK